MIKDKEKRNAYMKNYMASYRKANISSFGLTFDKEQDRDILAFLENLPNKTQYIKALIRQDMKRVTDNLITDSHTTTD